MYGRPVVPRPVPPVKEVGADDNRIAKERIKEAAIGNFLSRPIERCACPLCQHFALRRYNPENIEASGSVLCQGCGSIFPTGFLIRVIVELERRRPWITRPTGT
jgi:uncharacterized protein YbaR (Trm112 family)